MGYSVDLLKLMAEKIGLQLQFVNGFDFSELMELFEKGELEVVQSLYRTEARERLGLFSAPLYLLQTHVVSRETDPVAAIADLNGKTVAVPRGWYAGDFLAEHYPHIKRLSVANAVDALKAVATGRADAVLDTPETVHYLCRKYFINGLVVGPHFEALDGGSGQGLYLMVQKDLAPLRDLFNRALAS
ncbi:MAG: transporter substrate-binding domain-containing protein, partial [Desulfuromonadaceae bacterium]